jgi:hypothetical protein
MQRRGMAQIFREIPVDGAEAVLSGITRPRGFEGVGPRAGGPIARAWWITFVDAEGATLAGGSATIQWYAVEIEGAAITTPTIGGEVEAEGLATRTIQIAATLWPWCRVLAMTPPAEGAHMRVHLAESIAAAAEVDIAAIASAVALAVPNDEAIRNVLESAWGEVLQVQSQYFNAYDAGHVTGVMIAAPGAGMRIEILSWGVTTFGAVYGFTWSSGLTLNLDVGPETQNRWLTAGSQVSDAAVSPFYPLYRLAGDADFGITCGELSEVVVDIKYRVVPV